MAGKLQNLKGFTLIESMLTIVVLVFVFLALLTLYDNYYKTYNSQKAIISAAGSASAAANELQNTLLQADRVVASHIFSGTLYSSGPGTLVLDIPSVDSSGNIIPGKYDYAVFYISDGKLYKRLEADPASFRLPMFKLLSDTVLELTFTYNNGNVGQTNKIDVDMQTQAVFGHETGAYHLHQIIYLRNF